MIIYTKPLQTERLILKRGSKEDYYKVYEYDLIVYLKDGTPIGNIAAEQVFSEINAIDIIFNLHPNYWGNGYIKEGCIEVMRYLFSLGFDNILCDYDEGNYKSQRVNE